MSTGPLRLSLAAADDLAGKILETLTPVCERIEIAGSVRRRCPTIGDLEFVAVPRFSASLLPDVPGVSLLELELIALVRRGRLMNAAPNEGERLKRFYVPALFKQGHPFKVEINVSDFDRWPVEFAIKTGSAEFSKKLVTWRKQGGFLPGHWRISHGWQVWQGEERLCFESERQFIESVCGAWVPPEKRD